ncbi:unnamed protein product, partial [marine sediment metagenome]
MRMKAKFLTAFVTLTVLAGGASCEGVGMYKVVPRYMGDGLELIVTPTPQQAEYSDRLIRIQAPVLVVPKDYAHEDTIKDLTEALGPQKPKIVLYMPHVSQKEAVQAVDKVLAPDSRVREADPFFPDLRSVIVLGNPEVNTAAKEYLARAGLVLTDKDKAKMGEHASEGYVLFAGIDKKLGKPVIILAGNSWRGDLWAVQTLRQLLVRKGDALYVRGAKITDWPMMGFRTSKRPKPWEKLFKSYALKWGGS